MRTKVKRDAVRLLMVVVASVLMALNIKIFVRTGELYPGGVTGLSVLIQRACVLFWGLEIPYTPINLILNAIPVFIGFRYIGKRFTLFSCVMIVLTAIFTDIIPAIVLTYDTLLIAIFGGIINGFVISICLLADATSGGTDFIAIFLSEKKGMDSFNIILAFNVVILSTAGLIFGWDKALYSIIFQFVSTQVIHELYKKFQQETLLIVTEKPNEVCEMIYNLCKHGATVLEGEGAYGHCKRYVVYSVVAGSDSRKVIKKVHEIDEHAFINSVKTKELHGYFYQKPAD